MCVWPSVASLEFVQSLSLADDLPTFFTKYDIAATTMPISLLLPFDTENIYFVQHYLTDVVFYNDLDRSAAFLIVVL